MASQQLTRWAKFRQDQPAWFGSGLAEPDRSKSSKVEPRLGVVGGLRGIAALLVAGSFMALRFGPDAAGWQSLAMISGDLGFALAFVLSGYLATGVLTTTRDEPRAISSFLSRRAFRTLPLGAAYLAILLLSEVPTAIISGTSDAFAQVKTAWVHLWPLGVLWQFYLAWPLVVLIVPRSWLVSACLAAALMSPVSRAAAISLGVDIGVLNRTLPAHLDAFAMGAIASALQASPTFRSRFSKRSAPAMAFGLLSCLAMFASPWLDLARTSDTRSSMLVLSIFAASSASFVYWATTDGKRSRLLNHPSLRSLGRCGYALFIVCPASIFLIPSPQLDATSGHRFGLALASVAIAAILTKVSYECVDRPFGKLRRIVPSRVPRRLAVPTGRPAWPEIRGLASAGS